MQTADSIEGLQAQIDELREKLAHKYVNGQPLIDYANKHDSKKGPKGDLKIRQDLDALAGKVTDLSWLSDSQHVISASTDGKLIFWDPMTGSKDYYLGFQTWLMGINTSPNDRQVACCGLDNLCTIFQVPDLSIELDDYPEASDPVQLEGHGGYVSCCQYIDNSKIMTAAGDMTLAVWDLKHTDEPTEVYLGHEGDVSAFDFADQAKNTFISGGTDVLPKLWDRRTKGWIMEFFGHKDAINCIKTMPNNMAFVTGSQDSSLRMYDLRMYKQLSVFETDQHVYPVTCCDFSASGSMLFNGFASGLSFCWDSLNGEILNGLTRGPDHDEWVTGIEVSPDGQCVGICSRDNHLLIWA